MKNGAARRPRVLLVAELCNPDWVSVPLEGWSHYRALAGLCDAHLVTHVRNRPNVEARGLREGADFTALDSTPVEKPLDRIGELLRGGKDKGFTLATALSAFPYYLFEHLLWRAFGRRIEAREFDLVHRLTPLSPTTPSLLAAKVERAGVPFVMGPLNGGLPWPAGFERARRQEREWLSYVRDLYKLLPGQRSMLREARAIVAGSVATRSQLPHEAREKTVYVPENAVDPARFALRAEGPVALPVRAAFVGRLVPYKGADMLVEAVAPLAREGKVVLDVIGDGPQMPALRELVERQGVGHAVTLAGWVKQAQLAERLVKSHVFAFPSIREFGGAVVLEAMALGLVPVVVDYGGPGEHVSPATGFKVPIGPRDAIVRGFRDVLDGLARDPGSIRARGERARERVQRRFTWEAKAGQMLEVYRWVLGERGRPDFGMPFPDE